MKYNVVVTEKAKKDINKLDRVIRKRIKAKIIFFSQFPLKQTKKLINYSFGEYRFRVGNHRVIFDLKGKTIIILRIGHRREIYKK